MHELSERDRAETAVEIKAHQRELERLDAERARVVAEFEAKADSLRDAIKAKEALIGVGMAANDYNKGSGRRAKK